MTVYIGEDIGYKMNDDNGDLYIPREWIKAIIKISESNGSEYVGRFRRNENRYNKDKLPEYLPILEMYRGRSMDNKPISKDESDAFSSDNTTLDFHTHPSKQYIHTPEKPSEQDCYAFAGLKRSLYKQYQAVVSNGVMTLLDLSDASRKELGECKEKSNVCDCLKQIGVKEYILDGTQDVVLKGTRTKK